jgi:hypothetical protein
MALRPHIRGGGGPFVLLFILLWAGSAAASHLLLSSDLPAGSVVVDALGSGGAPECLLHPSSSSAFFLDSGKNLVLAKDAFQLQGQGIHQVLKSKLTQLSQM